MDGNRSAGLARRPGARAQDLRLVGVQRPVAADLADDAGLHVGAVDADRDVVDDLLGELVLGALVHVVGMEIGGVVARTHDDVHAGAFGDAAQGERVASEADIGHLNDGAAADMLEELRLLDREALVGKQ